MRRLLVVIVILANCILLNCSSEEKPGESGKETPVMQEKKEKEKTLTRDQAHQYFAVALNNRTWELLGKKDRTPEDNRQMIHGAHASCFHWSFVGTAVNQQRGEWLIARVYCELNMPEPALYHAQLCREMTDKHLDLMVDFDVAYSWEALARAHAASGDKEKALEYFNKAKALGDKIKEDEDKKIFVGDLKTGNWHGVVLP